MPQVKSTPTKRGAPKAKGAIRAKSGCYTCRIRRKKCDEQPDDSGRCSTCVRLRLECLGFGAKRPEWLRETNNVNELREKIKHFLAAQGMIKGHSTSSSRSAEQELPTLRLADGSDSSATPPTPTLSLVHDPIHRSHNTSAIRDDPNWNMDSSGYPQSSSLFANSIRDESPYSQESPHDPNYPISTVVETSNSFSPALKSSFSTTYTANFYFDDDYPFTFTQNEILPHVHRGPRMDPLTDEMVQHYVMHVVSAQYLFTDDSIRRLICDTVSSHGRSRDAASLLAAVHWNRFQNPTVTAFDSEEIKSRLQDLWSLLSSQDLASDDAMAALHIVSSYLFDGGSGQWEQFLNVSYQYVDDLFRKAGDPSEALRRCSPKDAFIIKTSMWFDVLASVTTRKRPHFLHPIRNMFDPRKPRIYEVTDTHMSFATNQTSMMSPMGCRNQVVWALAEISELAHWKEVEKQCGRLSMPTLVKRGLVIDDYLEPPDDFPYDIHADMNNCRLLASEIFRASARLYLRTVMSGDFPSVKEVQDSVKDTISWMERLNLPSAQGLVAGQTMSHSVVRNTVFGFFICGTFAEKPEHRDVIRSLLNREGMGAGNCGSIYELLHTLWAAQDRSRHSRSTLNPEPVNWRGLLSQREILLV